MGLCTIDYDNDLLPDIWVCNYENQAFALYKNDGGSFFRYMTSSAGLLALGTTYVAFGTTGADFDLDGDEDIVVSNGHVMRFGNGKAPDQQAIFLTNTGKKRFSKQSFNESSYFGKKWRGRGVVNFDFDHDGDLDLMFSHINQPVAILENNTKTAGKWLVLELVGVQSNRDAIGARVVFKSNKRSILRNVVGGGSFLCQNPYYLHVGIPDEENFVEAEITWPNGHR